MKIVITGGGSGGHFFPLIAVANKIKELSEQGKLLPPEIYYLADSPYDAQLLLRKNIYFKKISAGKIRRYGSIKNFFDIFKTLFGIITTLGTMFRIYPNVVFTNGSYISMPVLIAAKLLKIPVLVHASDTSPGRAVLFAARFAKKISISFPESIDAFRLKDQKKIALLGNPVREEISRPLRSGAHEFLELDKSLPTLFIMGGSLGAQAINDVVVDALPKMLLRYNVIHQCGTTHYDEVLGHSEVVLYDHPYKARYKLYGFLDDLAIRMSAGAAHIAVIRAGAGTITEVANWGIPSIVVPIPSHVSHDQESNAFAYARSGGCVVIKQANFSTNILLSELARLNDKPDLHQAMAQAAKNFFKPGSSTKIAQAIIDIALEHE